MVQFKVTKAIIYAMLATMAASAAIERSVTSDNSMVQNDITNLVKRGRGKGMFCKKANFQDCKLRENEDQLNFCYNLPSDWDNTCSSARVEASDVQCWAWNNKDCTGTRVGPIRNNNRYIDLRDDNFDNVISSYKCL